MKKVVCILVCCLLSLAVLGGCKDDTPPPIVEGQTVTLKLWGGGTQWKGSYGDNLAKFVKDFNDGKLGDAAQKLNIKLDYNYKENIEDSLATSLSKPSTCPNVVIWDRFNTPKFAWQDYLQPIDEYIKDVDLTKFNEQAVQEMNYYSRADNSSTRHYFGLPIDVDLWGIYVNNGIIEKYNATASAQDKITLKTDWTWLDVLNIAKKLKTVPGVNTGYSAHDLHEHFFKYMVSTGVDFMKDGTANVVNDEGRAVLEFFWMLNKANITQSNIQDIHFVDGEVAMLNQATYYGDYIRAFEKPESPIDYTFMPWPRYCDLTTGAPKENGINGGMMGGFGLAVPQIIKKYRDESYYQYVEKSVEFIKWWSYGEGAAKWAEYTRTLPALKELQQDESLLLNPAVKSAAGYVDMYRIRPNVRGFQDFQKNTLNTKVASYLSGGANTDASRNECLELIKNGASTYLKP